MFFWRRWILKKPALSKIATFFGVKGKIIPVNGLDLWYESFGNPTNPAFLLIMGAGCQGIFWTESFCRLLAEKGFFVIRFDHRDTGYSSYFNYTKNPYDFMDLTEDAVGLLDQLKIKNAHVMGISMGGAIGQLMAVHFPSRVLSLTLMATTSDFRPVASIMERERVSLSPLSLPDTGWFSWVEELDAIPNWSFRRKILKHLEGWELLNGKGTFFQRSFYKKLMIESLKRQRSLFSMLNHKDAILASIDLMLQTKGLIHVPTLIIHGKKDPLFPVDHAKNLFDSILDSKLVFIESMGHNFNPEFYEEVVSLVSNLTTSQKERSSYNGPS